VAHHRALRGEDRCGVSPRAVGSYLAGQQRVSKRIRVREILVTTNPGGGAKARLRFGRPSARDEFEFVIGAPRDGIFFYRFRDLGLHAVEFPLHPLDGRHFFLATRLIARSWR